MLKALIAASLLLGSALAADNAVLRNGFAIRHERRELLPDGATTRLFISISGKDFVDVQTASIAAIEPAPPEPVVAAPPKPPPPASLAEIVRDASDRNLLDEDLIHSVIMAESAANARAVSNKGAQGLMQLMPATARSLGVYNAFDSRDNVEAGTRHLHALLVRFNFDLPKALAAYNAGADAVVRYNGVPPYPETRAYVARIIRDYNRKKLAQAAAARAAIHASARANARAAASAAPAKTSPHLPPSKS